MAASSDPHDPHSYETYKLGDWQLQRGGVLKDAFIAYKTIGNKNNPCVVYPTWYSGSISDNLWLIGPDKTLSPSSYYIVIPALFGNGQSTSPSNSPNHPFPTITLHDNIRAQHALLTQHLAISHARLITGWSMGAAQTFQWGAQYPDFADALAPFCGSARCSLHNRVFLEGVKGALLAARGAGSAGVCEASGADDEERGERFRALHEGEGKAETSVGLYRAWTQQERTVGLKALGRVYAGWGFSQAFYRARLYETSPALHFKDLEDFMVNFWEAWACSKDPENMLVMLSTWQNADISAQQPYNGDFEAALKAIKAPTMVMPCRTDLYFPPEDSEYEVRHMAPGVGRLEVFESIWGHWAGGPGQSVEDVKWLDEKLRAFLQEV